MSKKNNATIPIPFSYDLLSSKVRSFVETPRMLNAKMRRIIATHEPVPYEDILDYCLKKGWRDAIIYERLKSKQGSKVVANAESIVYSLRCKMLQNDAKFVTDYDSWHKSICLSADYGMKPGIWQKFINMTLKYLYCFKDVPTVTANVPWNDLHCPIDSVIAEKALDLMKHYCIPDSEGLIESISNNGLGGVNWNNISINHYNCVQEIVDDLCSRGGIPSKLFFDFIYWDR